MRTHYNAVLKATIRADNTGRVRGIIHVDEYRDMRNAGGREAAVAYIREIAGNLKILPEALRNLDRHVSYLEPRQQDTEFCFSEEKVSFDSATYAYYQTFLNTPVWETGITVTLKQPARIVGATNTSEDGIDAKLPSSKALERYRELFATAEDTDTLPSRHQGRQRQEPRGHGSDLLTDILGGAVTAQALPVIIRGRFFIYRYDAKERTEDDSAKLPLPAVPESIKDGSWRLVAELAFRLPHNGGRMNWRMLVDVQTNTVLYLRAMTSCIVMGRVFTYDPVTSTGMPDKTAVELNGILDPLRADDELRNLDPPTGNPLTQSLDGAWASVTNFTPPNIQPPTRPAGSNFDIWHARSNEFAAVSAYYHVDRFFRLVEELGFPLTGANPYFGGTQFPIEVDHRGFRPPAPDGNVINAGVFGGGDRIDSVYFALADLGGGFVSNVIVTSPGSNYPSNTTVQIISGSGGGSGATATAQISGGTVSGVTVNSGGSGYRVPPLVKFVGSGGTDAFAIAEIDMLDPLGIAADWRVTLHELGGHGTLWPHVHRGQFKFAHSAGDSFAMILNDYISKWRTTHAIDRFALLPFIPAVTRRSDRKVDDWSLACFDITNRGSGYLSVSLTGGGGTGAVAGVLPQHIIGGAITKVTVIESGIGYTSPPSVNFSGGGGNAVATAQIMSGSVSGITVTNGGTGYVPLTVSLNGGGGTGARATVKPEDVDVIDGHVNKITVVEPGKGYTTAPAVTFSGGGGAGLAATAKIGTWAWGGGMDQGTDGKPNSGYFSEQILSTTMFRAYQSIGGDSLSINRREFAARCMTYLMLEAIGKLTPMSNPESPAEFLQALQFADATNWISEGVFGGAYSKVLAWAFEKQHLNKGLPPLVDVYIDDGRAGEYEYTSVHWATTAIWNRRNPDGLSAHQEPASGQTNFAYVKIKNRGTSVANNVIVKGYHCRPSAGVLWPNDLQPFTTPQLSVGTLQPNNTEEKIVGPFEWTPVVNGWGHDCMLMIVSATGDPTNADKFNSGEVIEDWRLVPNDNNVAQRNVVLVPGGGKGKGLVAGLRGKGFWVGNPGRCPANVTVSVTLPAFLVKRGWRLGVRGLPADGLRLKPREHRRLTFDVTEGASFSNADVKASGECEILVAVAAEGAPIGGMTYRIDPELEMPF